MALEANALIDRSYLRQMWRSDLLDDLDFADELINQASAIAERVADRNLVAREVTEIHDGLGGTRLLLKQWPIVSVASVHVDAARNWEAGSAVTGYYYESGPAILHYAGGFGRIAQSVRVVYTGGLVTVPSDLKEAAVELVSWLWTRQRSNTIAVRTTDGLDGTRTEHEITIPLQARRTIELYGRRE